MGREDAEEAASASHVESDDIALLDAAGYEEVCESVHLCEIAEGFSLAAKAEESGNSRCET